MTEKNQTDEVDAIEAEVLEARKRAFLASVSEHGNIKLACDHANVNRREFNSWRKDEVFQQSYIDAMKDAADLVEAEARRRAMGYEGEVVTYNGQIIYKINPANGEYFEDEAGERIPLRRLQQSDRLLEVMLKGNVPKYKDRGLFDVVGDAVDENGNPVTNAPTSVKIEFVGAKEGRPAEEEDDLLK